jgi:nitroimidazol reductase NimA-like FMN-containing flavoprotein (pyridoxamine 5'-phosphate oxidase superfamily)
MPGYGILDANSGKGLFPWSWATERLTNASTYWIATVRSDGRPHVMPVWGVWLDDAFYFSSGMQSRKMRNLNGNSHCVITCEVGEDQLIVEGGAEQVSDAELRQKFCDVYQANTIGIWKVSRSRSSLFTQPWFSVSLLATVRSVKAPLAGFLIIGERSDVMNAARRRLLWPSAAPARSDRAGKKSRTLQRVRPRRTARRSMPGCDGEAAYSTD